MQRAGIQVIPAISWAAGDTYSFCFSGIDRNSVVSISTVGTQKTAIARSIFLEGCRKMCSVIKPRAILIYGSIPDFDFDKIETVQYKYSRYDWKKRKTEVY